MMLSAAEIDSGLHALSDPTRRAIVLRLKEGEAMVTELAGMFPISLNSVSKHIMVLERAGLLRRLKSGREHWLTLDQRRLGDLAVWLSTTMGA
ncbi:MAG: winged helix-turn-helix transcriptional regulator [Armatimonadetes bacterium]|nr:winged helix-turn-helix transcriptional regulator [Armatimonadota bacterium]